ncbi:hypothetical protein BG011_003706 [Mortierella polycephala]|uniref:Uncharacterized protein n=1 Tax=Mortierella polycephala TaxID=41804 RepID=A0A9P6Q246_9FUNG|nr:hypothetical protein BG011_003706 [Mortierella polycephala]
MAFSAHSGLLKLGFVLSITLFFLGMIVLGSLAKFGTTQGVCLLFNNGKVNDSAKCSFSVTAGAIIALAGCFLFGMDWVTWKRSENYKGKNASVAALFLAPLMCIFSFCTAIVIGLGIKSTCNYVGSSCSSRDSTVKGIYTGISCAALAGLFFALYSVSEYTQYRRRHIEGDKVI